MKLRLTLTLDVARVRDDPPGERDTQLDAYVENNAADTTRRRVEYPFGFATPEDHT